MKTETNLVKLCMQIRDCICQGFLLPPLPFFQRKVLLYFWKIKGVLSGMNRRATLLTEKYLYGKRRPVKIAH